MDPSREPKRSPSRRPGTLSEWVERHTPRLLITPAVVLILAFAIFPTIVSLFLSVSQLRLARGGYGITVVGLLNFRKLLFGSQQFHFVGTPGAAGAVRTGIAAAIVLGLGFRLVSYLRGGNVSPAGLAGRLVASLVLGALALLTLAVVTGGGLPGSLVVTLFYVVAGVTVQFAVGLLLAVLCAQPIAGRGLFRLVFFLPLTVTPVGIAYVFRMLADMSQGPFAPLWRTLGLGEFAWASQPWSARIVVLVGDSWQWIPFVFIVLLAAIESLPDDHVEAARIDGATGGQVFRYVTWPGIAPAAATVVLIRVIEAFKIVDLPNVLTNGGPGIATESMTLHAFIAWRTQDLGGSAAVGYMLLFVAVVTSVSFFNFVVRRAERRAS